MEYFVLMATLIVLFFGLLFFVKSFPAPWIETAAVWIAVIVIIVSIIFVCLMALHDVLTRLRTERTKKRKLRQTLISKFGEEQAKKHLKEYESNLFTKSTKTIIEDLDEGNENDNNPWIIIENEYCRVIQEELMQFKEEDWYNNDHLMMDLNLGNNNRLREKKEENDKWIITENQLRKLIVKYEEKDDWIVLQNPLNEQNQFDYEQLEMKIYHVQFNLPFFEEEGQDESSDEDRANSINDILDNLFSKERIDKKKKAIKRQLVKFKKNYLTKKKGSSASEDEEEIEQLRREDGNDNDKEEELNEGVTATQSSLVYSKEESKKEDIITE